MKTITEVSMIPPHSIGTFHCHGIFHSQAHSLHGGCRLHWVWPSGPRVQSCESQSSRSHQSSRLDEFLTPPALFVYGRCRFCFCARKLWIPIIEDIGDIYIYTVFPFVYKPTYSWWGTTLHESYPIENHGYYSGL